MQIAGISILSFVFYSVPKLVELGSQGGAGDGFSFHDDGRVAHTLHVARIVKHKRLSGLRYCARLPFLGGRATSFFADPLRGHRPADERFVTVWRTLDLWMRLYDSLLMMRMLK